MPTPFDRLAPPPTVYPPTQADQGAQVFYYYCMVCHGDRGQGLTPGFRSLLGVPDNNCWAHECHASNRIDGAFRLPRVVPAVIGKGALSGFKTGLNLYDFISTEMPYQAPGMLSQTQYWQLAAFLLRSNGYYLGALPLNAGPAQAIHLDAPPPSAGQDRTFGASVIAVTVLIVAAGAWWWLRRRKDA